LSHIFNCGNVFVDEHFDEKRAITPKWVIRFTSKLQGR
jgi:hypothetical protein